MRSPERRQHTVPRRHGKPARFLYRAGIVTQARGYPLGKPTAMVKVVREKQSSRIIAVPLTLFATELLHAIDRNYRLPEARITMGKWHERQEYPVATCASYEPAARGYVRPAGAPRRGTDCGIDRAIATVAPAPPGW